MTTAGSPVGKVTFDAADHVTETFSNDLIGIEIREGITIMTFGVRRAALAQGQPAGTHVTVVARLALTGHAVGEVMRQFSNIQNEIVKARSEALKG